MADVVYNPPDGYLTMTQVMDRLRVTKAVVQRMVRRGDLKTFEDPRDLRFKLFKVEDVAKLEGVRPAQ